MAKNKIQFQKGLSLPELLVRFGSEEQCRQELFHLRWPQGYQYPKCGHDQYCGIRGRKLYQCKNFRFQASVTQGTIFAATKLPLHIWLMGIYLTTQSKDGISSLNLGRKICPMAYSTERDALRYFRQQIGPRNLHGIGKHKIKNLEALVRGCITSQEGLEEVYCLINALGKNHKIAYLADYIESHLKMIHP